MKRVIAACMVLIMMLVCLTGCAGLSAVLDQTAGCKDQVQQMVIALTEGDQEKAMALMHPTVDPWDAEVSCAQMSAFLDGRKLVSITTTGVSISSFVGIGGKTEQETATFRAELEGGDQMEVSATYLKDSEGEGFVSFRLTIGLS